MQCSICGSSELVHDVIYSNMEGGSAESNSIMTHAKYATMVHVVKDKGLAFI